MIKPTETISYSKTSVLTDAELGAISGGDFAINLAVKAYEALGQRLTDAVHPPAPKPTMSLHMR